MIIAIPLSKEKLLNYDVILLAGGHVPTQNRYFKEIDLKKNKRFSRNCNWNNCRKYELYSYCLCTTWRIR